jgi:hypothetical protein
MIGQWRFFSPHDESGKYLVVDTPKGARGSVVVKALCYKPEGRKFDIR